MKKHFPFLFLLMLLSNVLLGQEIKPLFEYWQYYADHSNVLYRHLTERALDQLDQRKKEIGSLETKADWMGRQTSVRQKLEAITGGFPEKTPLNPRITGTVKGNGFRVEKVIYESQPGFYVTAAFFIPDNLAGKAPAVLYCSGHTFESFRSKVYQHMIINLVKKGCVVLAFDPIGQGERLQYLDETGKASIFQTPTHEHSYPGGQSFIAGSSLASLMIWDGIRSVDYLLTRPEVDPERIGITGRSGGGTQSAYIAAFDPRIRVTAPECYITGFEYIFKSIGPQDAEQNFPGYLHKGLDLADLLEVRAPKPAIIISTTRDFFSIQGARDTYEEVKKVYMTLGSPGNIAMSEDDAEHETTLKNREALYGFLKEHLQFQGGPKDQEVTLFDPAELQVTTTGQVIPELNGETIFSLNRKMAEPLFQKLDRQRQEPPENVQDLREAIIQITGYEPVEPTLKPVFSGREEMERYVLEKYIVQGGGNYYLPVLVLKPISRMAEKAVVILNPEGKEKELADDGLSRWFIDNGHMVVIPDLAGFGELGPGYLRGDAYMEHTSYNQWFAGILTGKSPVGLRMAEIHQIAAFTRNQFNISPENISAVGRDLLAPDLMHAAAVSNDFAKIMLIKPLVSYRAMVMHERYHPRYIRSAVQGSIKTYDLPDLAIITQADRLLMIDITDQNGDILKNPGGDPEISQVFKALKVQGKDYFIEVKKSDGRSYDDLAGNWLE